jgi:hypothetical protein
MSQLQSFLSWMEQVGIEHSPALELKAPSESSSEQAQVCNGWGCVTRESVQDGQRLCLIPKSAVSESSTSQQHIKRCSVCAVYDI